MTSLALQIEGVGIRAPGMPDWQAAQTLLCGNVDNPPGEPAPRPAPRLVPPGDRRRAPDAVLFAVDVAQQACAHARRDPATLPHVFACANGDLAVTDYLCATLASAPHEVSPTKFHNSVHNAPAGYWTIAAACRESSTAMSAGAATFAAGLLEAGLLACREACPVLLVAYDLASVGPLRDVIECEQAFAAAFVLAPQHGDDALARLRLTLGTDDPLASQPGVLHAWYPTNPAARSLPLLAALAQGRDARSSLPLGPQLFLSMEISF